VSCLLHDGSGGFISPFRINFSNYQNCKKSVDFSCLVKDSTRRMCVNNQAVTPLLFLSPHPRPDSTLQLSWSFREFSSSPLDRDHRGRTQGGSIRSACFHLLRGDPLSDLSVDPESFDHLGKGPSTLNRSITWEKESSGFCSKNPGHTSQQVPQFTQLILSIATFMVPVRSVPGIFSMPRHCYALRRVQHKGR